MTPRPRILQVLYSGLGGHGAVFYSVVRGDRQRTGEHVAIFHGIEPLREDYRTFCLTRGLPFHYVRKRRGPDPFAQAEIVRHLRSIRPQVIILHSPHAVIAAALYARIASPKPFVIAVEHQANQLKTARDWLFSRLVLRLCDKVVYLTPEYESEIRARIGWPSLGNIVVIPSGLDTTTFTPIERPQTTSSSFRVGMQSRLTPNKDHISLLQAISILERRGIDVQLALAGEGESKQQIRAELARLGLQHRVSLVGELAEQELIAFLNRLDTYVHSTHGETLSTAIMQAQACALPIVASDVPGVRSQIREGGLLVRPADPVALANALQRLSLDHSLRRTLGTTAREYVLERHDETQVWERYEALWNSSAAN